MTEVGGHPANWYPDPFGRFELRYYDGAQWTEHVSNGGTQQVDAPAGSVVYVREPATKKR